MKIYEKKIPHFRQLDAMDCGSTCLRMISKFYGKTYSLQSLRDKSYITREGVSMMGIADAAESIGFRSMGVRITFEQLAIVGRIAEGSGHADLVMDLGSLAMLGKNNPAPLEAVSLDMTKFDLASQLSEECSELLGRVHGARTADDVNEKEMRDRAFTHLKEAVDTIREAGRFLFWKDEKRALLYGSQYFRELRANRNKEEAQEA